MSKKTTTLFLAIFGIIAIILVINGGFFSVLGATGCRTEVVIYNEQEIHTFDELRTASGTIYTNAWYEEHGIKEKNGKLYQTMCPVVISNAN